LTIARIVSRATQIVEFSPSDEYEQTMAIVAKNLQGLGS